MRTLNKLQPSLIWQYFEDICQVPRPSKKEEKIRKFLLDFASDHKIDAKTDEIGNVLFVLPATKGKENLTPVVMQAHMDMVCDKKGDKSFNFETDAIVPVIEGEWVRAEDTTLGADNGIGIAAQLAIATDPNIIHGTLECLFTVDEETGLNGAVNLKQGFFKAKTLINLDSEDEGVLYIGCAGGLDTQGEVKVEMERVPEKSFAMDVFVKGLKGGHSGDDIEKERGNAIKILTRYLWCITKKYGARISVIDGGNLRNAIAREAHAQVIVSHKMKEPLVAELNQFAGDLAFEYKITEPDLQLDYQSVEVPEKILTIESQKRLLSILYGLPHGVLAMSSSMKNMVETSTNLASVHPSGDNCYMIITSQRSEIESRRDYAAEMVEAVFELGGAKVIHSDGYPGWTPNTESKVLKVASDSYRNLFKKDPVVRSIHAGLECGLFLKKYPDLDMVSFGPTIQEVHSPSERIKIDSVKKFYMHLAEVLKNV